MMVRLKDFNKRTPFHNFICDGCGGKLGEHWLYRPESRLDILGISKKHDGKFYCNQDRVSFAGAFHQRELNNINTSDHPLGGNSVTK